MRLYDLASQYNDLIEALESDPDNSDLQAMLDGLEGKIEDKIDAVLSLRNAKRAEVKALRDEAARLTTRASQAENSANRLEELAESAMAKLGVEKIRTLKFTAWIQAGPPSVLVTDETLIPEYYFIPQPAKLDRRRLLDDIKEGIYDRPDAACISQTKSIRIR